MLPMMPVILVCTAVSGAFGFTIMLCVVSDLLAIATVHIKIFYSLAARWHGLQATALSSLWRYLNPQPETLNPKP
jgi:hypothetical protein